MKLSFPSIETVQLLIGPFILVTISLFSLYAIDHSFAYRQIISLLIGIVGFVIFSKLDYSGLGSITKYIYIGMIAILVLLLLIGPDVRGSVRWFDIFGIRIQASEVIKPFFIIAFANYLSGQKSRSLLSFIKSCAFALPIIMLVLIQPDLGSAIIFAFITLFMIFMYAFPLKYLIATTICVLLPTPFIYEYLLHDYQRDRITSFINATQDPFGTSYNSIQALISIGSGRLIGKGFGESTQSILQFLPEHHTDFIFASISESLGFVGASIVLLACAYFLYILLTIARNIPTEAARLIVYGAFAFFFIHITFNIGMNLALLPVVGITLPFVSYGGSALITSCIMLGIVASVASRKDSYHSYEIS